MSTWKKIVCVAVVLLAIGGGVAGYILSSSSNDEVMTENVAEDGTPVLSSPPPGTSRLITPSATATQSSELECKSGAFCSGLKMVVPDGLALRAIDGNTDGNYPSGSATHTFSQADPWWKVTGISGPVSKVKVWNRSDCCTQKLDAAYVSLRDENGVVIVEKALSGIQTTYIVDFGSVSGVAEVRVGREGMGSFVLAEVEVLGSSDETLLSSSSVASQSSDIGCGAAVCGPDNTGSTANAAIDGNTDGSYPKGSVTRTWRQVDPWLLISLGFAATVKKIVVWNRTDCCGEVLVGAKIELLDSSNRVLHAETITSPSSSTTFDIPSVADVTDIRVRLETGDQKVPLSVAEVEAFGQVQSETDHKSPHDAATSVPSSPSDLSAPSHGTNFPSGSPTEFQQLMGPSEEDCKAISDGMAVADQDSLSSERYSVDFEVTLKFAMEEDTWRSAFTAALQSSLIPRLAGCRFPTPRRLRERIANTANDCSQQRLLQSQLAEYNIRNGLVGNTTVSDFSCGDTASSLCFKVNVVMDLWLVRDTAEELEILGFITDVLGEFPVTTFNLQGLMSSVVLIVDEPLSGGAPSSSPSSKSIDSPTIIPTLTIPIITPSATATQSSELECKSGAFCSGTTLIVPDGLAFRAIDGNTDGNYPSGSATHTLSQADPWWKVTGISGPVSKVKVWNRSDCCTQKLDAAYVSLRDDNGVVIVEQALSGSQTTYIVDFGSVSGVAEVRVRREGMGSFVLAEVEVLGSSDESLLSSSSVASQSSDIGCGEAVCGPDNTGAGPEVVIDGNTDGSYPRGSVTHTWSQVDPWILISLGLTATVKKIVVWNRTDCCGEVLVGAKIELLDSSNEVLHTETITSSAASTSYDIPSVADVTDIRIRLETGDQKVSLSVAEVEAFGIVQL